MVLHDACGRFCAGVPASVVIRDQILTLSFSRSQRQYWTVGNRPIRKNDLRSLHRNSVEAQIQDRSRQKTGLNTAPLFTRLQQTSPSRSEGDACAARRGCPKFTTPVIPRTTPSFPRAIRHSRGRGNPEKTKHTAKPPLRGAKGTRAQHAGDARKPPTPPLRSSEHQDNPSIIPPPPPSFPRTTPSFPRAIRHSRGLPRHSREPSVIPADAGTQQKQSTPPNLPFAQRRGRVRSTQGMPENHQHPPFEAPNTKTTPPSSPHPLRHSRKPVIPSFPRAIRHSRGRGNPEKNKAHRQTSPSRSEGDACAARRGCPKTTNTAPSKLRTPRQPLHHPPTPSIIPPPPRKPSVIPASLTSFPRTREPREKQSTPPNPLPFAERRGRVRSTQGMPENHQTAPSKLRQHPRKTKHAILPPSFQFRFIVARISLTGRAEWHIFGII